LRAGEEQPTEQQSGEAWYLEGMPDPEVDIDVARGLALEATKEASRVSTLAWGALVATAMWLGKMSVENTCEVVWSWVHLGVLWTVTLGIPTLLCAELKRLQRHLRSVSKVGTIDIQVWARAAPLFVFAAAVVVIYTIPKSGKLGKAVPGCEEGDKP